MHRPAQQESDNAAGRYRDILGEYLRTRSEGALYRCSLLSNTFIEAGLGPEDIVALHFEMLRDVLTAISYREQLHATNDAQQFLLEIMIAYGVRYKEYLELRLQETLREAAARAAWDAERIQESELVQAEKMALLAVIAHELRTPLTAVKGCLDLMERTVSGRQLDKLPSMIATARDAAERLSRLTSDLVAASRGEIPQLTLTTQDLGTIVLQAVSWAGAPAGAQGLSLDVEPSGEPVAVTANADALLSVFGNLLANAIHYTHPGGRVTIGWGEGAESAWVAIQDTGVGMSAGVQEHIFERFYRSPEAQRLESRGLGLGLALVAQLVEAHSGRIAVRSAPGEGSTFRIELPRIAAAGTKETP